MVLLSLPLSSSMCITISRLAFIYVSQNAGLMLEGPHVAHLILSGSTFFMHYGKFIELKVI